MMFFLAGDVLLQTGNVRRAYRKRSVTILPMKVFKLSSFRLDPRRAVFLYIFHQGAESDRL